MRKLSFNFFTIITFISLSLFIVGIILSAHFVFGENYTKQIVLNEFEILSADFTEDMNGMDLTHKSYVDIFTSFVEDKDISYIFKNKKKAMKIFVDFLYKHEFIYALYIGKDDDSFFNIRKVDKSQIIFEEHKPDENDKWLSREIFTNGTEIRTYYDKNLDTIFSKTIKAKYKATSRPWYKEAIKFKNEVIRTEPYKFDLFVVDGITYSKEYKNGYVFGADLLLESMSQLLENRTSHKTQNACLIDKNFSIIAKTNALNIEIAKEVLSLHVNKSDKNIKDIKGKKYIFKVEPFGKDYLVLYANFDELMLPHKKELYKNIIVAILVILVLSFFIWIISSVIMKPICLLAKQNRKIASRDFKNIKNIKSNIKEISELSDSVEQASKSIEKYQNKLERLNITDYLTKIYNRTKLDSVLRTRMEDFNRYGHQFGFMMIDIDFFKKVNDEFGHQVGDEVLKEFSSLLKDNIRENDIIGRWGGEEFAIICKEINIKDLEKLAEKLRQNIQNHSFETIGHKTASFGVSVCCEGDSVERLANRADEALYKAKESGRNKVIVG